MPLLKVQYFKWGQRPGKICNQCNRHLGTFVVSPAFLRTFPVKYPVIFTEVGQAKFEDCSIIHNTLISLEDRSAKTEWSLDINKNSAYPGLTSNMDREFVTRLKAKVFSLERL